MTDGVHIRLMVTRGPKSTPYQDPRMSAGPATVVIIAEHKDPLPATVERGLSLFTVHVRRASPDTLDPEAQCAQQAQRHHRLHPGLHRRCGRGVDARPAGVRRDVQLDALLHRRRTARCGRRAVPTASAASPAPTSCECADPTTSPSHERLFSLTDVYSADEAFVTGTFAGVVPVRTIDGRTIGTGARGPMVAAAAVVSTDELVQHRRRVPAPRHDRTSGWRCGRGRATSRRR